MIERGEKGEGEPTNLLDRIKAMRIDYAIVEDIDIKDPRQRMEQVLLIMGHNQAINKLVRLIEDEVADLENPFLRREEPIEFTKPR